MAELVTIGCPQCGFSRHVPRSGIPEREVRVTCPKCRTVFALSPEDVAAASFDSEGAVPPPVPSLGPPRTLSFSFQGNGREYFGIWIVNILLKLVTCGIYSAWAKVRKRSYFYGSTMLEGEPFAYLADPLTLFKGWLIGAAAFLLYMVAQRISVSASMVIALIFFIAVPWLVVRSSMFNARNSAHRNIRFSFRPNYSDAYMVFLGFPLLAMATFGLLMPYVLYRQKKFLVENSLYGTTPFRFGATPGQYYRVYLRAFLALLAIMGCVAALLVIAGGMPDLGGAVQERKAIPAAVVSLFALFPLVYFILGVYLQTSLANLGWNATEVGTCRFRCSLRLRDMAWLYLSNAVAIACTLGLFTPWAAVRLARYRCSRLSAETRGGLDTFLALARREEIGAAGEEVGDIFGVNVDLGF